MFDFKKTIYHLNSNLILYVILALALVIRLYGIQFGLPGLYHADETIVVNHALAYGTGDLNPHFFKIPPLVSYLIFFEYGIYFLLGTTFGFFSSIVDFQKLFLEDPTSFYLIGRITVGAIAGTASVFFIYVLGKNVFSKTVGIISAFFLALTFLHVRNSHYIYLDIMMVLFIILTCIFIHRFLETGLKRDYVLAGCFTGIAIAVKYNAGLLLAPLMMGHLIYCFTGKGSGRANIVNSNIILSMVFMVLTYVALNPYCLIDIKSFIVSFSNQARSQSQLGFLYHLRHSLFHGLGAPLFVLCIIGSFISICKFSRKLIVFASFPVVYYLSIAGYSQPHARYVLPLIPFLLIFAARFLEAITFREGVSVTKARILITAASIMVVLPTGIKSVHSDYIFSRKDTRLLAKEWIEDRIPYGTKIAIDHSFYAPKLYPSREQLEDKLNYVSQGGLSAVKKKRINLLINLVERKPNYNLYFPTKEGTDPSSEFLFARPVIPFEYNNLQNNGIEYVIVTNQGIPRNNEELFLDLKKKGKVVARFTPYKDKERKFSVSNVTRTGGPLKSEELYARERKGEIIYIYKLDSRN